MKSIQFFSYNVRFKHLKMDCLHKEVKNLLQMLIKCYFVQRFSKTYVCTFLVLCAVLPVLHSSKCQEGG